VLVRRASHHPDVMDVIAIESRRRGARRPALVPSDVLAALESGQESANHMEQIAMDMGNLLASQFPPLIRRANELRDIGLVARMRTGGRILYEELGLSAARTGVAWTSDTARGWAAMAIGYASGLPFEKRLELLRPFADDAHFAVREWAWLSLRPHVAADTHAAIALLISWTAEDSERLRRFASEATRPRGVWSAHLPILKSNPERGLPLLEPLRADPSRYVQDSVSNWLNDASKSQPEWVESLCETWERYSPTAATARIRRRACRSLPSDLPRHRPVRGSLTAG
jgi:3-methyladenine DNA glycosylase AlkC